MNRGIEQARLFLRKAAEDEALLEAAANLPAISDAIYGFHAQQAVEKLLKALLSAYRLVFRPTHNLSELAQLLAQAGHGLPPGLETLERLTPFAVAFRYDLLQPSCTVDRAVTRERVRQLRQFVEAEIRRVST